jgi:hypothetical protein
MAYIAFTEDSAAVGPDLIKTFCNHHRRNKAARKGGSEGSRLFVRALGQSIGFTLRCLLLETGRLKPPGDAPAAQLLSRITIPVQRVICQRPPSRV